MSGPAELALHRSLLRAAVLASLIALVGATGLTRIEVERSSGVRPIGLGLLLAGCAGWVGLLVAGGDLAGAGSRLRRALVVALTPALLPWLILCLSLHLERGAVDRASAWETPALAFRLLQDQSGEPALALLLASLLPFAAALATRAQARPRPLWAHAAVVLVSSYASLLLLERLTDQVGFSLSPGRLALLVCGPGLALILLVVEARLGTARDPRLRWLAGRAPPRSRGPVNDTLLAMAAFCLATALSSWVYPFHFAALLERRARAGDVRALEYLVEHDEAPPTRLLLAVESAWSGERAAAFELATRTTTGPNRPPRSIEPGRAMEAARHDPSPRVRLAATRHLALEGPWDSAECESSLRANARPESAAALRFWAQLGLALRGVAPFPPADSAPLYAARGEDRRALGWFLVWTRLAQVDRSITISALRGRRPRPTLDPELARLALLSLATSGLPSARSDVDLAVRQLASVRDVVKPSPVVSQALAELVRGVDRTTLCPELAALAGLDGPP